MVKTYLKLKTLNRKILNAFRSSVKLMIQVIKKFIRTKDKLFVYLFERKAFPFLFRLTLPVYCFTNISIYKILIQIFKACDKFHLGDDENVKLVFKEAEDG